jgi:nucleotide-binding universal stress UspA family protein
MIVVDPRPATDRAAGFARVLLATDLSPASDPATEAALRLAAATGAEMLAVSVIDPRTLRLPGGRYRTRVDQVRASRQAVARELVERGREVGVDVTFLVWEGEPGPAVLEAAEAEDVDVIVVGRRALGAVGRLFLGSVSQHVVQHARRPVLVVHADAGHPEAGPAQHSAERPA